MDETEDFRDAFSEYADDDYEPEPLRLPSPFDLEPTDPDLDLLDDDEAEDSIPDDLDFDADEDDD